MDYYGPDHWETLYQEARTPWDAGTVPDALRQYVSRRGKPGRVLVPGCGSGYEAAFFATAGSKVLAIDFSPSAVARARRITRGSGAVIQLADFFELDSAPFDCVYERAFLCALPPRLHRNWANTMARLVRSGGQLAGLFFIDPAATDGPPFGMSSTGLAKLLEDDFALVEDLPSGGSLPVFENRERWQVWERKR
ncbi:MAG: methyltransferase domain-containing protein [Gammaproteobacteria bacterium]|nr:MAG: methyltransferase domain-containing protein [Gammaproteobacteria bacterium]